jgi:hypothetical protein
MTVWAFLHWLSVHHLELFHGYGGRWIWHRV